jgi:hypothetical protein
MKKKSKNLKCILLSNGMEIWEDADKLRGLIHILVNRTGDGFLNIDDGWEDNNIVNSAQIVGIFTEDTIKNKIKNQKGR